MAGLPLLKLSTLLVKTIAKPVAARMKVEASRRPAFHDICTSLGQRMHYLSSRLNVFASGYKFVGVKPLAVEQALNDGIGTISEALVLSISASVIIIEYRKSEAKAAKKSEIAAKEKSHEEEKLLNRFQAIEDRLHKLEIASQAKAAQDEKAKRNKSSSASSSSTWGSFWSMSR